ncbi:hypothetical protein CL654_00995 [bacterium]|nr:hypothetical protein [bacterium]
MKGFFGKTGVGILVVILVIIGGLWFVGNESQKAKGLLFVQEIDRENDSSFEGGALANFGTDTETSKIARELYNTYLEDETGKDAEDITEVDLEKLLDSPDIKEARKVQTFTTSDIQIVPLTNNSQAQYEADLAAINQAHFFEDLGTESNSLKKVATPGATTEQKEEGLAELKRSEEAYRGMRDGLLVTPVPTPFVSRHLELVNTFEKLTVSTQLMQNTSVDPVYIIPATQLFTEALQVLFALQT